ncbi:transglycosylase domain-containing protein [Streptomyces roseifaciens]
MGRAEARRAQNSTRTAKGKKPKKAGKTGIRRFFTWKKLLAYFVVLVALGAGACVALYLYVDIPKGNSQAKLQSNIFKDADGKVIARSGDVNRQEVPLDKIPENVRYAVVAAENKNFYTDPGVDVMGTARGILNTVMGRGKQGGSTITQQYVKNYYLDQRQTVTRKVKELVISLKVQKETSKNEILAGYLNTSFYGRGAYGIQAASRAYYNKDVDKLSLEEGAYLAALLQAPSQYDWSVATPAGKENAKARWNYVLDKMVEQKWLDKDKRAGMQFKEPGKPPAAKGLTGQNGYLVEAAKAEMRKKLAKDGRPESDLDAGGWTITLSVDNKKQKALEKAVKDKLLDDLDPKARAVDKNVQVGAASVDPKTGKVVALYGGTDALQHWTNNATREDYQVASTFKPLIFASALENKSTTQDKVRINAGTLYDSTTERPVTGTSEHFAPENEDGYSHGMIPVQKAMNDSVNSVFAQMAIDVGLPEVKKTAVEMGMNGKVRDFVEKPAMSLGSMGNSPLHMAGVYATLAHHGKKVTPSIIKSASQNGKELSLDNPIGGDAISRNTADGVTTVLKGVVDDGTASVVQSVGRQVAGKTGTSDDNKSAWFTGYTPDLVTAIGLFGEGEGGKQVTLKGTGGNGRVNGGTYPARIWAAYTANALQGSEAEEFDLETNMSTTVPVIPGPPASSSPSAPASHSPSPSPSRPSQSPSASSSRTPSRAPSSAPPSSRPPVPPVTPSGKPSSSSPATGGGGLQPNGSREPIGN